MLFQSDIQKHCKETWAYGDIGHPASAKTDESIAD